MGTFSSEVVSSSATERDFLGQIYTYVTGLWEGITCSVTNPDGTVISPATVADVVWAQNASTNIDFTLDANAILRFQSHPRDNADLATRSYNVFLIVNGTTVINKGSNNGITNSLGGAMFYTAHPTWQGDGIAPTANGSRKYLFAKYISDNVDVVWLGQGNAATYSDAVFCFMRFKGADDIYRYMGSSAVNIMGGTAYNSDGTNPCTSTNVFSYASNPGYIDYISKSSFISGGIKSYETPYIYNCSTVTLGSTCALNDGNYFALGANFLVKL